MKRRLPFTLALSLAAALGVACENGGSSPTEAPVVEAPGASAATPAPAELPVAKPVEVTAPFLVSLSGPVAVPAAPFEITVVIDSSKGFAGATTLSVELPPGARLVAGEASEKLETLPAGKTERTFKISAPKLTAEEPVRVVVEGQDPAGQFGARAVRAFPEPGSPAK